MTILKTIAQANALILQSDYVGAEKVLDYAIIEARELILERDNLKTALDDSAHDTDQMRIRMGEMAAEIERLNAEREQLLAQEPEFYYWRSAGESSTLYRGDYSEDDRFCPLYAQAVPAQQDNWLITIARECADACSDWPEWRKQAVINAMQQPSPAVAVPLGYVQKHHYDSARGGKLKGQAIVNPDISGRELVELVPVFWAPSPRITEQDAGEVSELLDAVADEDVSMLVMGESWHERCSALLNKLNAKPEST